MKATVKGHLLNVRRGKPSVNAPVIRVLIPGAEIETGDELIKGDPYEGVDIWLKDEFNNFYWSGGLSFEKEIETIVEKTHPVPQVRAKFAWFEKLKIETLWDLFGNRGEGTTIAILDTGYNLGIPDVADAVAESKVVIDARSYPGKEFTKDDESRMGHGTRCISLAASRNRKHFVGVAPASKILSAKVSVNRELMNFDFILEGISWAISKGAEIISISYAAELSEEQRLTFEKKYDDIIRDRNVLIFAASGNAGMNPLSAERYPASFSNCISIGATDLQGIFNPITIQSNRTILHAPGINIESIGLSDQPDPVSGTSYSTPIVAGIAALAISHLKKRGQWDARTLLAKLYESGDPINETGSKKIINGTTLAKLITV
jgi:subtilisin family serine protease